MLWCYCFGTKVLGRKYWTCEESARTDDLVCPAFVYAAKLPENRSSQNARSVATATWRHAPLRSLLRLFFAPRGGLVTSRGPRTNLQRVRKIPALPSTATARSNTYLLILQVNGAGDQIKTTLRILYDIDNRTLLQIFDWKNKQANSSTNSCC